MLSPHATSWSGDNSAGSVTYHQTTIVEWTPSGIRLRHGGHDTLTTKKKMNQASKQFELGFSVFSHHGTWFVNDGAGELPFHDGIHLDR
jgi:hypothetical protein